MVESIVWLKHDERGDVFLALDSEFEANSIESGTFQVAPHSVTFFKLHSVVDTVEKVNQIGSSIDKVLATRSRTKNPADDSDTLTEVFAQPLG
jgi:hypothetical protein